MDMENLVANTVYVTAKTGGEGAGGKGRSKKWQEYLPLPPLEEVLPLKRHISLSFDYIIEGQPIGEKLFHCFCQQHPVLAPCCFFLSALEKLETLAEEKCLAKSQEIFKEFIDLQSPSRVSILIEEIVKDVEKRLKDYEDVINPTDLFSKCKWEVLDFLKGEPFSQFLESPYFTRYLQWKALEKVPVTKHLFRQYRVLGKGGFGQVYACQSKATGRMYAMKTLQKKRIKKKKGEKLTANEKDVLLLVNSRFVVNLVYAYQTKDLLCMILTLMNGGDLRFHIHHMGKQHGISMERVLFYAAELTLGLQHMHAVRVAYRDMKPENLLLDDDGHIRISDLGLAVHIPEGQSVKGRVGTVGYMAPEVVKHEKYTFSPDWFSLGCVIYEMISGNSPFRGYKEKVTRDMVEKRVQEVEEKYNDKFSEDAKLLCQQFLTKDPKLRLGYKRGAEEVKAHPFFSSINWVHLERGFIQPTFIPDPKCVYYKDILDIEQFSSVRGVNLDMSDEDFYAKFDSGCSTIPWQKEMLETGAFNEVNSLHATPELILPEPSHKVEPYRPGFFEKLFGKKKKKVSAASVISMVTSKSMDIAQALQENGDGEQEEDKDVLGPLPPQTLHGSPGGGHRRTIN